DIEYVDASVPDLAIVSVEKENVVQREEEEIDLEDISQVQDVVLREKLFSITRLISNIESLNDNSTPDQGDIRFLEELLIDDSNISHESFDSNFEENLLISRPPLEPPDDNFDLETEDYPLEIEVILCSIYVLVSKIFISILVWG
nr:hypothetical protein [Tanacetum cinerariifolium]